MDADFAGLQSGSFTARRTIVAKKPERGDEGNSYYAEAVDGAFWAGPFVANVSNNKFQKCSCLGVIVSNGPQPYYDVGMRELDTVKFSGVNLVP